MKLLEKMDVVASDNIHFHQKKLHRWSFMRYTGVALATGSLFAMGCKKDDITNGGVNFGTDDFVIN